MYCFLSDTHCRCGCSMKVYYLWWCLNILRLLLTVCLRCEFCSWKEMVFFCFFSYISVLLFLHGFIHVCLYISASPCVFLCMPIIICNFKLYYYCLGFLLRLLNYSFLVLQVLLKGDPILGAFLHKILGKVLLMNSLDVSTLFVNQNMSYL